MCSIMGDGSLAGWGSNGGIRKAKKKIDSFGFSYSRKGTFRSVSFTLLPFVDRIYKNRVTWLGLCPALQGRLRWGLATYPWGFTCQDSWWLKRQNIMSSTFIYICFLFNHDLFEKPTMHWWCSPWELHWNIYIYMYIGTHNIPYLNLGGMQSHTECLGAAVCFLCLGRLFKQRRVTFEVCGHDR